MMQHLLRRLVFDVPLLNEHAKMPLKVSGGNIRSYSIPGSFDFFLLQHVHLLDTICLIFDAGRFLLVIEMGIQV